jgi:hypothetical protein
MYKEALQLKSSILQNASMKLVNSTIGYMLHTLLILLLCSLPLVQAIAQTPTTQLAQVSVISWPSELYKKNMGWLYAADVVLQPLEASQYAVYLASDAEHQRRGIRSDRLEDIRAGLMLTLLPLQERALLTLRSKTMTPESAKGEHRLLNIVIELVPRQGGETLYREIMLSAGLHSKLSVRVPHVARTGASAWLPPESDSAVRRSDELVAQEPAAKEQAAAKRQRVAASKQNHSARTTLISPTPSVFVPVTSEAPLPQPSPPVPPVAVTAPMLKPAQPVSQVMPTIQQVTINEPLNLDATQWLILLTGGGVLVVWLLWRWWRHTKVKNQSQKISQIKLNGRPMYPDEALNTVFGDPDNLAQDGAIKPTGGLIN